MSRKENALDLAKFVDKAVRVKLSGGREGAHQRTGNAATLACGGATRSCLASGYACAAPHLIRSKPSIKLCKCRHAVEGVLKGYDPLLNLVLDETKEFLRGAVHTWGRAAR